MTDEAFPTTAIPPAIEAAWLQLSAAIAHDVFAEITIGQAADALIDVYPPYPPAAPVASTIPQHAAVDAARAALRRAEAGATNAEEQLRIASVLRMLRDLNGGP